MTSEPAPQSPSGVLASVSADLAKLSQVIGDLSTSCQGLDGSYIDHNLDAVRARDQAPKAFLVAASMGRVHQAPAFISPDVLPDKLLCHNMTAAYDLGPQSHGDNLEVPAEAIVNPASRGDDVDSQSVYSSENGSLTAGSPENGKNRTASVAPKLHEIWRQTLSTQNSFDLASRRTSIKINEVAGGLKNGSSASAEMKLTTSEGRWSVRPNTTRVFAWDTIGGILIMNDIIVIPIQWLVDDSFGMFSTLDICVSLYWTCDILFRFFAGYETAGGIEMRLPQIAQHYMCGWFLPDVCACLLDWSFILQGQGGLFSRSWHIIRVSRSLRIVPRSIKFKNYAQTQMDRRQSERLLVFTKALLALLSLALIAHYSACVWYAIGNYSKEASSTSWLEESQLGNVDLGLRYLASLSWSLSQSGFLCVDMYPTNSLEHLFCVFSTLVWIAMMLSLIGCFNLLLMDLQKIEIAHAAELVRARKYLKQRGVPSKLTAEVIRFIRRVQVAETRYVPDSDMQMLAKLPLSTQFDLRKEIYTPVLKMHPLFQQYAPMCKLAVGFICYLAMSWRHYEAGQEVFLEDEESDEMLFVVAGGLKYFPSGQLTAVRLGNGSWVGEASLWSSSWKHRGQLVADTAAEIAALNATKLREIVAHGETLNWNIAPLRSYANKAMRYFIEEPETPGSREERPMRASMESMSALRHSVLSSFGSLSRVSLSSIQRQNNLNAGVDSLPADYVTGVVDDVFQEWGDTQVARNMYQSSRSHTKTVMSFLSGRSFRSVN